MEAGRGRSEPRTLAPGWDPGAPLLAPTDLPMGKFSSPSRLSTNHPRCPQEGGWPLPAGKPMGTRGMNPQPCALGGSQEHRTAHRNEMVTAHSRYTTWLSPKPLPQWRKATSSLWPGGHSQSLWTRGDTCPGAPPKRGWRTLCGRGGEQLSCACPQEAQGE